ncbi:hypothetical protein DL93DRAFT_2073571 [Clavulina sp. PMI_390]|nr:hypothetical protein DL93DRAFT_2073571 [Clavulina sp. PMI_390]
MPELRSPYGSSAINPILQTPKPSSNGLDAEHGFARGHGARGPPQIPRTSSVSCPPGTSNSKTSRTISVPQPQTQLALPLTPTRTSSMNQEYENPQKDPSKSYSGMKRIRSPSEQHAENLRNKKLKPSHSPSIASGMRGSTNIPFTTLAKPPEEKTPLTSTPAPGLPVPKLFQSFGGRHPQAHDITPDCSISLKQTKVFSDPTRYPTSSIPTALSNFTTNPISPYIPKSCPSLPPRPPSQPPKMSSLAYRLPRYIGPGYKLGPNRVRIYVPEALQIGAYYERKIWVEGQMGRLQGLMGAPNIKDYCIVNNGEILVVEFEPTPSITRPAEYFYTNYRRMLSVSKAQTSNSFIHSSNNATPPSKTAIDSSMTRTGDLQLARVRSDPPAIQASTTPAPLRAVEVPELCADRLYVPSSPSPALFRPELPTFKVPATHSITAVADGDGDRPASIALSFSTSNTMDPSKLDFSSTVEKSTPLPTRTPQSLPHLSSLLSGSECLRDNSLQPRSVSAVSIQAPILSNATAVGLETEVMNSPFRLVRPTR